MNSIMIKMIVWQSNLGVPVPTPTIEARPRETLENGKRRRLNDEPVVEEVERYDNDLNGLDLIKNLYADEIEEEIDELIEGMKNLSLS